MEGLDLSKTKAKPQGEGDAGLGYLRVVFHSKLTRLTWSSSSAESCISI